MSHYYLKTEYNDEGYMGSDEKHTLYAHHNNGCDVVSIYDDSGHCILSFEDTRDNNILDAINRLVWAWDDARASKLTEGVNYMDKEEREKIFK